MRKEKKINSNKVVNWARNQFPGNFYELILNSPRLGIYWSAEMKSMLSPRLYEISEVLGIKGIAEVFYGKRCVLIF
jgi:hypothetical protein